jgi:hypothetical protein
MPVASSEPSPLCHGPSIAEWETAHELLKHDALWTSLAFDGIQHDGRGGLLEFRRCPRCTSTIGRSITLQTALEVCVHQASLQERSQDAVESASRLQQGTHAI